MITFKLLISQNPREETFQVIQILFPITMEVMGKISFLICALLINLPTLILVQFEAVMRGGTTLNAQAVVPDTSGTPGSSYVEEEDNSSLAATIDGTGLTYDLKSVNTVTVNTDTYNIESITNAKSTLTQITTWIENLASERANVGANMSRLEKEMQNLNGKITTGEMAVGRIQDTDVATESTKFASSQVRMQASIAILAQAKDLNVGISDLIRGIMIGQS